MSLVRRVRNGLGWRLRRVGRRVLPSRVRAQAPVRLSTAGRRRTSAGREAAAAPEPWVGPRAHDVAVAVAGADWFTAALEPEWHQSRVGPDGTLPGPGGTTPALVLLQWLDGEVPGLDEPAVDRLLSGARAAAVPTAMWATHAEGATWPQGHPVASVDHVYCDDAATTERWRTVRPDVVHLPAGAQVRFHRPRGASRDAALVAGLVADGDGLAALTDLPSEQVDLWPAAREDVQQLHQPFADRVVRGPVDAPVPTLGRYDVAVATGAAPGSTWPLVAAAAAGTALVLDEATAGLLPPDLVAGSTVTADPTELRLDVAARCWQQELRDREGHQALRAVRGAHTTGHRARTLLQHAGAARPAPDRSVSVVVPTNRPHELSTVIENVGRQTELTDGQVELVLVLHGIEVDEVDLRRRLVEAGVDTLVVVRADPALTLGRCMGLGVAASSGRYVAKVDDDNYYGRHYLRDLLDAFEPSGAQIVGKWAHYVWLRASRAVVLRNRWAENRPERLVQGGSMIIERDLLREIPFSDIPRAVDTDLLNRVQQAGAVTYSADRFGFVSIRGTDRHSHTWPIADTALMNRAGSLEFFGDPHAHVEV